MDIRDISSLGATGPGRAREGKEGVGRKEDIQPAIEEEEAV